MEVSITDAAVVNYNTLLFKKVSMYSKRVAKEHIDFSPAHVQFK